MSVHMARNWWAIGLRGVATIAFGLAVILTLPSATTASLVTLFAAYLAADGFFAILTAERAAKHARRWWMQILEGLTNLGLAGWVLLWPAIAAVAFLHALSIWAIITGGLLLAAARRLSQTHGRWVLAFAGAVSTGWGILLATLGPDAEDEPGATAAWLIAYAVLFGVTLLALGVQLRRRHHRTGNLTTRGWRDGRVTSGARPP
jgi:uncharacterized membrane protein HdeD (DUF308 family)